MDIKQKIAELEEELRTTKYNKATQHHIGLVKAKIARLKRELALETSKKSKHTGFSVKKTGDATVVLVGFPSVGKSTLLNLLTNAKSDVGDYDFTTIDVVPGMLFHKGARIQLLDIPGLIEGASQGFGRGKEVLSIIKTSDLMLIVLDERTYSKLGVIQEEVYNAGIRLDTKPPDVSVAKRGFGGIDLGTTVKLTKISEETVKGIMREMGFANASIVIRQDISADELIDVLAGNRVYMPSIVVVNKVDKMDAALIARIKSEAKPDLFVSSTKGTNIKQLKELIFSRLRLMRVYLKQPRKKPDLKEPLIMHEGATIRDVCERLHKQILANFKYARVWGSSKFPGQKLGLSYLLRDRDIVELVVD
ncbi:GTP-binding protein [Candidatus Woesearchaeota archaeon]|nr:GTP-binding protein [Candidatus Woesearchaeota archaeon]RLE43403.1 MAG: GTP-binding protein [Candidatus Woesearchaeota archaeon]